MVVSRRQFIKSAALAGLGLGLGTVGCSREEIDFNRVDEIELAARAQKSFDPDALVGALNRIRFFLEKHNPKAAAHLRPGLSGREIERLIRILTFQLPEELRILYGWSNGLDEKAGAPFIWYHDFPSLERILGEYEQLNRFNFFGTWRRSWFPIFTFQGENYFAACKQEKTNALPIRFFFNEEPETHPAYVNLTTMMLTAAEWYESSAVTIDAGTGVLKDDIHAVRDIYQKYNKGLRFPYHVPSHQSRDVNAST